MAVQRKFRTKPAGSLTSFDFTDIARGKAIQIFFGGSQKKETTETYILSDNVFYSYEIEVTKTIPSNTANFTLFKDIDYDVEMGFPRTIDGVAIINVNTYFISNQSSLTEAYLIAKVRKYDGTTETDLASGQCVTLSLPGTGTLRKLQCFTIDIPRTHFSVGDIFRLTIELWAKNLNTTGTVTYAYGQDPNNREGAKLGAGEVTRLEFHVPFKIDI